MNIMMRIVVSSMLVGGVSWAATGTYVARSQSRDKVRQVVGVVHKTHRYDASDCYANFSVMPVWEQSFRGSDIAECLFGTDIIGSGSCNNSCDMSSIKIQGSTVNNRDPKAWLADYFYLAPDFDGAISFSPRIRNFLVDFDFYAGFDRWVCGSYFRMYGPVVNTHWDLRFAQTGSGSAGYDAGYFDVDVVANTHLNQKFSEYAGGKAPLVNGLVFNPLRFAKLCGGTQSKTGFADLRMELGWDFLQSCDYHLGVNIQAAAPTGSKQCAEYVFSPLVGNGHHGELGAGLTGHYIFWRCDSEDKEFGFYVDANITHLFKTTQQRTFDLVGKQNSRYMLAEKLGTRVLDGLAGVPLSGVAAPVSPAVAQFKDEYTPVANLTTAAVRVSANVQADIVALFNYSSGDWSIDVGYNFWARSCQKFQRPGSCGSSDSLFDVSNQGMWALKGDALVYGFASGEQTATEPFVADNQPVALSATQSESDIHSGRNTLLASVANQDQLYRNNRAVDYAQFAVAGGAPVELVYAVGLAANPDNQVLTSIQPVFLKASDVDLCQSTRGLSHKLFWHGSYTWSAHCVSPYLGLGGFAEFGTSKGSACDSTVSNTHCSHCTDCALSQWGVWLKAGVSFN